ncbi:MAG: MurR/RpiR family transcriptional regulator [Oscillospiraceae bacterium]|nr:MurR/RpiR family transcriptional regulator [Oscillospiraceae bacterium]
MAKNILHTIEKNMISFSKGQKLIARFILENYDKAAFMTASKLGKTVQVSESTVVRFAAQLGYDGYPSMQRALQEMIRGKLTSIQRIQASDGVLGGSDLVTNVLHRDMEKIRMAIDQTDAAEFDRVADTVARAKRVYIVGFRSSSFLAGYLNFYFRLIFDNVTLVQSGAAGTFDQIFRVGPGDVVFAICFPRYSELALKTVQFAKERGATITGLTDSEMSPIARIAECSLLVHNEMISFVDSLAAPMSMLNALILACARKKGTDVSASFSELEHVWERFSIFGKVEDE